MTLPKPKTPGLSQAQIKRIEEVLCQMAIDGRGKEALIQMRAVLTIEFMALSVPPAPVLTPN